MPMLYLKDKANPLDLRSTVSQYLLIHQGAGHVEF